MHIFKKTISFLLIFVLLVFIFSSINKENTHAAASTTTFSGSNIGVNDTGQYKVQAEKAYNVLPYGVLHYTHIGASATTQNIGSNAAGAPSNIKNDPLANEGFIKGNFYDQQVNIIEVPSTTGVRVTSWANLNNHKWALTSVRSLVADFEAKHPNEMVIAAINGDYCDVFGTSPLPYHSNGLHISNGENYKTLGYETIGLVNDGSTDTILNTRNIERKEFIELDIYDAHDNIEKTFNVQKINQFPEVGETAVYYGLYDNDHNYIPIQLPTDKTVFVVGKAELALPNSNVDFYGKGVITTKEPISLQKGQFAIVTNEEMIKNNLEINTKIRVQWNFTGVYKDIKEVTGIGGETIMNAGEEGEYRVSAIPNRAPRTLIGKKADGTIVLAVADGRQPSKGMYGFAGDELVAMMKHYGAYEAYNLDGGGSSTMLIRQGDNFVLMNSPSDGWERNVSDCILVVVEKPKINITVSNTTQRSIAFEIEQVEINRHDIKNLYISLNNKDEEVIDGKAEVANLQVGSSYNYSLYYRDSRGQRIPLLNSGEVSTLNYLPLFKGVNIINNEFSYLISIDYTDRSNVSNYDKAPIKINGKSFNFIDGQITVLKEEVGAEIVNFSVLLEYAKSKTDQYSRWVNNPQIKFALTLEIMIESLDNKLIQIYK